MDINEMCVAVMGRGTQFCFIDLSGEVEYAAQAAEDRGLVYVGALAFARGEAGVRCQPGAAARYTMFCAALGFADLVADRLRPLPKGDSVGWLDALHRLPDMRP